MTEIRQALQDDEAEVRSCAEDAYAQYVAAIGRKPAPMVADFAALISADLVYVAESPASGIDGFTVFYARERRMFLENVAVNALARGKGVGRKLIGFCEAEAARLDLDSVDLYTNALMTTNLSIYPHLGYEEVDRREEDGFSRVYFRKRLS